VHSFVRAFVCSLVHSFVRSSGHSCIRSFVHSFLRSCIRSFVHPGIRAFVAKLSALCIKPPSPEGAKYPSTGCSPVFSFVRASVRPRLRTFVRSRIRTFVHSYIRAFVRLCIRLFARAFVRSFIRAFVHSWLSYPHYASSRPALKGRNTPAQGAALCFRPSAPAPAPASPPKPRPDPNPPPPALTLFNILSLHQTTQVCVKGDVGYQRLNYPAGLVNFALKFLTL